MVPNKPPDGLTRDFNRENMENLNIRIAVLETEVKSLRIETIHFQDKIEKWMEKISDKLENLPCDKREGRFLSINTQFKWLWTAVTFIMVILSGLTLTLIIRLIR